LCQAYSCSYLVHDIAAICALARIGYDDFQVWLLVENLLYPAVIATFGRDRTGVFVVVVVVKLRRLVWRSCE
jgi:hypothetical protein